MVLDSEEPHRRAISARCPKWQRSTAVEGLKDRCRVEAIYWMEDGPMSEHKVSVKWARNSTDFGYKNYNRDHVWRFDSGVEVPASAAPAYFPMAVPSSQRRLTSTGCMTRPTANALLPIRLRPRSASCRNNYIKHNFVQRSDGSRKARVFAVAQYDGQEASLKQSLARTLVASIGTVCSVALRKRGSI
jgi:hypothetical protein